MDGTVTLSSDDLDQLRNDSNELKKLKGILADTITVDLTAYEEELVRSGVDTREDITNEEVDIIYYYAAQKVELNVKIEQVKRLLIENIDYKKLDKEQALVLKELGEYDLSKLQVNYLDKMGRLALVLNKSEQEYLNTEVDKAVLKNKREIQQYIYGLQEGFDKKSERYKVLQTLDFIIENGMEAYEPE